MTRLMIAVAAAALLSTPSLTRASACNPNTGAECECGWADAAWNVPKGGLVVNRSAKPGPITSVIDALNEHWTHSAVSHGLDASGVSWGSMSTSKQPRSYPDGNSSCNAPIEPSDLANGWPGARTDPAGGLWAYYYGDGGQTDILWILPGSGSQYNNGTPSSYYGTDLTVSRCLTDWEKNQMAGCSGNCLIGNGLGYSVYAYSAYMNYPSSYGTMCSGLQALSYYRSINPSGGFCTPNGISLYTYANWQVQGAANSLYNSVYNTCSAGTAWYEVVGAFFACWFDGNLCDEAGDQAVNCFAYPQGTSCTKSDHDWASNGVSGHTATSISPARLSGSYGQYSTTPVNNSPWQPYAFATLSWNSPGSIYGCWY